jgi:simple sugar transport system ATP-binding protein
MSDDARALRDGPATAGRPVVEAIDISKTFGSTQALVHVDLTVHSGSTHALVGRNGAGKSTLVSILTGLQPPDDGRVLSTGSWRRR